MNKKSIIRLYMKLILTLRSKVLLTFPGISVLIAILMLGTVSNIFSQEIGVSIAKIWTGNYEMQNPYGYGIYIHQPLGKLSVKLEFMSASSQRNYFGYLAYGFLDGSEQNTEEFVSSNSNLRSIELSVLLSEIVKFGGVSLDAGLGASSDRFECSRFGNQSQKNIVVDSENKLGFFYEISVYKGGVFGLPVKIGLEFKHKVLSKGDFTVDAEQPFANLNDIKKLQLNISYGF